MYPCKQCMYLILKKLASKKLWNLIIDTLINIHKLKVRMNLRILQQARKGRLDTSSMKLIISTTSYIVDNISCNIHKVYYKPFLLCI